MSQELMQHLTFLTTIVVCLKDTVAVAVGIAVVVHCVVAVAVEPTVDDNSANVESSGWDPKLSGRTALDEEDSRWVSLP